MKLFSMALGALLPVVLVACGGKAFIDEGAPFPGSDGGTSDGGRGGGGGATGCPETMPTSGSCSPNGLVCEYGTNDGRCGSPFIDCENGKWTEPPIVPNPFCSAPSTGCPATRADVQVGTECGGQDLDCEYPDGRCGCIVPAGGPVQVNPDGGEVGRKWLCESAQPGCPVKRPRVGTSCAQEGQSCDYGSCLFPDGTAVVCHSGRWDFADFACAD